jgi:hypothetical protein
MKHEKKTGQIEKAKTKRQWQLYQQIGELAETMRQLPDAAQAKRNPHRSAPVELLPVVF